MDHLSRQWLFSRHSCNSIIPLNLHREQTHGCQAERRGGMDGKSGLTHTHDWVCTTDAWGEPPRRHRELSSVLRGDLNGKETQNSRDGCVCMAGSLCWTEQTIITQHCKATTLQKHQLIKTAHVITQPCSRAWLGLEVTSQDCPQTTTWFTGLLGNAAHQGQDALILGHCYGLVSTVDWNAFHETHLFKPFPPNGRVWRQGF